MLIEQGGLLRDEQIEIVDRIVEAIASHGALVNEVLRVADGAYAFEPLPRTP